MPPGVIRPFVNRVAVRAISNRSANCALRATRSGAGTNSSNQSRPTTVAGSAPVAVASAGFMKVIVPSRSTPTAMRSISVKSRWSRASDSIQAAPTWTRAVCWLASSCSSSRTWSETAWPMVKRPSPNFTVRMSMTVLMARSPATGGPSTTTRFVNGSPVSATCTNALKRPLSRCAGKTSTKPRPTCSSTDRRLSADIARLTNAIRKSLMRPSASLIGS